ncbi:MAG: DUF6377 domain-containing protein [Candidatus Azobacteroides sp.]|nr:DUF6377 domain-containing protein [Candidatus Azobacteroides sp.]
MERKLLFLLVLLGWGCATQAANVLDSLLTKLDKTIRNAAKYDIDKQSRIEKLKIQLLHTDTLSLDYYQLNLDLYKEYKSYTCDSAIYYLNVCVRIAKRMRNLDDEYASIITLSHLLGSAGMYKEAVDRIETIQRNKLPTRFLIDYYDAYAHIYGELAFYTQDKSMAMLYREKSDLYIDSLNARLPADSEMKLIMDETRSRYNRNFAESYRINDLRLAKVKPNTPEHALAAYHRSLTYQFEGNSEEQKHYLALSALSDIRSATKDHASLWMLAEILYEEGNIERAYEYIRFSWNETMFYNARLRNLQSASILSLIDKTYQSMIEKQNSRLQLSLILIAALMPMLILAIIYIYKQMKKLSTARSRLQDANDQLIKLNSDLKQINVALQKANIDLTESNQIKEEYIGRFINLCSTYIEKLDGYRRVIHKNIQNGQITEVLKITSSQDMFNKELKELYANFDTAFLQLFPNFEKKVNELLQPNDPIVLKKGELLNTELRILALIRLGIDDSFQISKFLRYAVNTIYNYRVKIKNRAKGSRDDFENQVMKIK